MTRGLALLALASCSFVIDLPELPICGDALVDGKEECDDGNANAGDGCNPPCTLPAETLFNSTIADGQSNPRLAFFSNGGSMGVFEDDSLTPPDIAGSGAVRAASFTPSRVRSSVPGSGLPVETFGRSVASTWSTPSTGRSSARARSARPGSPPRRWRSSRSTRL
mgnify:CR=1 FL=1